MKFAKMFLAGILAFFVGSILVSFFWLMIAFGLAGSMEKTTVVPEKAVLMIDFSENIVDSPAVDPLAGFDFSTMQQTMQLPIFKALRALEAAAADERIEGIYLRMNGLGGVSGTALLEELREAVEQFKASGKFVVAYNETYSQAQYYMASVADEIYIQPEGGLDWIGLSADIMFYKGLFDKLDIKAEVFRPTVCKYKSAVEPYILDKMSPENRAQMQALVDSMWETISQTVSKSRNIPVETLNSIADNLQVAMADEALAHGFVDGVIYEDEMDAKLEELCGGDFGFIGLGDYAMMVGTDLDRLSADEVAVVYADGQIVDGESYGAQGAIYGNTLAATIAEVRMDDKVKAVVLRVNSPGGSALASDIIWREIELLRAEKPLIVSMGSAAASGGYYISCPADAIVADRMTLTGSIGVFGMYLNTEEALKNKLGITYDGVKSNAESDMSGMKSLSPVQRAALMRSVDRVYATFTGNVAEGRNLPIEKVLDIAGGRVWSGEDALEIGLVDGIGGLKTAIAIAVDKAGLGDNYRVREVVEPATGFAAFIMSLNGVMHRASVESELGEMFKEFRNVQEATKLQGVVMYSPYKVEL